MSSAMIVFGRQFGKLGLSLDTGVTVDKMCFGFSTEIDVRDPHPYVFARIALIFFWVGFSAAWCSHD